MSTLWLRIRSLMKRGPLPREGGARTRPPARQGSKDVRVVKEPDNWLPILCGLALLALHLILFPPVPRLDLDFPAVGQIAAREVRAPFTFKAELPEDEVQVMRWQKVMEEPPALKNLGPGLARRDSRFPALLDALAESQADTASSLDERATMLNLQFPVLGREDLRRLLMTDVSDSLVNRMGEAWRRVLEAGVVDMLPRGQYDTVVVMGEGSTSTRQKSQVVTQAGLQDRLTEELRRTGLPAVQAVNVASMMRHFISPNLVYDLETTQQRKDRARDSVPTTREFFKGERIVDRGVRVTPEQDQFLQELKNKLESQAAENVGEGWQLRYLSRVVLLGLALGLFGWFGVIHFPNAFRRLRTLLAITILMALFLGGAHIALNNAALGPFAVPVVLLSLVVTVLFRDKVGYNVTLLSVTLLAILPQYYAGQVFAWYLLGMVTVVSVRRIRKRGQFYQAILVLALLSTALIFLLGAVGVQGPTSSYLVGIFAPVLLVAFGLFLLPVVEPLVGVCSDLTLLELSDLNHPLLQRMALEAQGTYHHSQVVGQLAEHAARTVEANSLLTRVGALFHDIGKMEKSEYYVENQHPEHNKHDELSPSMSALVIGAHVKEGIELGRRWRLPQAVIDFIPQHHGTMVMEYFYHKALSSESNAPVKVDDFRYPGPKPQSRETAILMLADAVEAATRSLGKPTPSRIREITKQIIDKRMLSGELDESGLTLSDLSRIREAFIPLLTGIHHARIVYPGQKEKDPEKVPEKRGERKAKQ